MQSVLDLLVHSDNRLILLFTPPFDKTQRDPGYIKGYVPGIRENGGQYHMPLPGWRRAFAQMGDGEQAWRLYQLLNPIYQSDSLAKANVYKVEPYVIVADIYSTPPHVGRGGWSWYTGSGGWMYRLGLEAILGFQVRGKHLSINPVIPADWEFL